MDITIFKDIKETSQPFYRNVDVILKRIQEGYSKDLVKKIRAQKNKEKRKIYKQERIEKTRIWEKNRYKTNINFRLTKLLRTRLRQALKGIDKSDLTLELIGCTIDELKKHLESKFEPWMSWENQGRGGWDIDHIIAMSKFDLKCPVQQHACCHWSNLQPLGHIANMKKGTK